TPRRSPRTARRPRPPRLRRRPRRPRRRQRPPPIRLPRPPRTRRANSPRRRRRAARSEPGTTPPPPPLTTGDERSGMTIWMKPTLTDASIEAMEPFEAFRYAEELLVSRFPREAARVLQPVTELEP